MYEIHSRKDTANGYGEHYTIHHFTVLHRNIPTLEAAAKLRVASGDLVVVARTHRVVQDTKWLFDWEKENPNAYAHCLVVAGK